MLFHKVTTYKTMSRCWKRAEHFAAAGEIPKDHYLSAAYWNFKMFFDAKNNDGSTEEICFDAQLLDWLAGKIDEYAKDHILKDDLVVSAILWEWKKRMFFNPVILIQGGYH